ncbi:DUF4357 domain-containing protein [Deinococcus sp.]|uniref:DUF4357 domain-containing protein n=1 Tax=Deinococcus sp. TaxID=47478 RepID=UPI003B5A0BD4
MNPVARQVKETVEAILRHVQHSPQLGEALVRQIVVLRLLQAAGFDIWNPTEVVPEETNVGGRRPDFLIRAGPSFALEIKGMNVSLRASEISQALSYATNEGVRWALLTNGRVWLLIDEHKNGRPHEREVLRLEMTFGSSGLFATDLAALLDAEAWRTDMVEQAVEHLQQRLKARQQVAEVILKRKPTVEQLQLQYGIPHFEKAVELTVKLGQITDAEGKILLGQTVQATQAVTAAPAETVADDLDEGIEFWGNMKNASAHVRYSPAKNTWTLQPGSTFLDRQSSQDGKNSWREVEANIKNLLETGGLLRQGGLLKLTVPLVCDSPSRAGSYVIRRSVNGWNFWKDAQGKPAQQYRPQKA